MRIARTIKSPHLLFQNQRYDNSKSLQQTSAAHFTYQDQLTLQSQGLRAPQILFVNASSDLLWPLPNNRIKLSSKYGKRIHPITHKNSFHKGIDIPAPKGTPILAAAGGIVKTGSNSKGYGNWVKIDHGNQKETLYAHASRVLVEDGQWVRPGQMIALVGSTGNSTGPHLHFEVRENKKATNPQRFYEKNG